MTGLKEYPIQTFLETINLTKFRQGRRKYCGVVVEFFLCNSKHNHLTQASQYGLETNVHQLHVVKKKIHAYKAMDLSVYNSRQKSSPRNNNNNKQTKSFHRKQTMYTKNDIVVCEDRGRVKHFKTNSPFQPGKVS